MNLKLYLTFTNPLSIPNYLSRALDDLKVFIYNYDFQKCYIDFMSSKVLIVILLHS